MGFFDDLFKPMPVYIWYPHKMREQLKEKLETASDYLLIAEGFVDDADKLRNYRAKIDDIVGVLSLRETAVKNVTSAVKIMQAVSDLSGNIRKDPQKAAKAFGKLFSGIGELAGYLPFPISSYLEIFAEAENFFENLRAQMQPEVHMREPGLREVIDNLQ